MNLKLEIKEKVEIIEIKSGEDLIRIGSIIEIPETECKGEVKTIRILEIEEQLYYEIISKTIEKGKLEYTSDFHFLLPGTEFKISK